MSDVRLVATNPDDGTLVPVASNSSGQLAVQSPSIEKVPNDLDVEGDLNVSGNATFAGGHTTSEGVTISADGQIKARGDNLTSAAAGLALYRNGSSGTSIASRINFDGGAEFATGSFTIASTGQVEGDNLIRINRTDAGSYILEGQNNGDQTSLIQKDGSARFQGDVTVGSRNKSWMLVEQGGLCHMVEQTRLTADLIDEGFSVSEYPKLRDVFKELDLIEQALNDVMEKLRLNPPAGWEVWDGSDNL